MIFYKLVFLLLLTLASLLESRTKIVISLLILWRNYDSLIISPNYAQMRWLKSTLILGKYNNWNAVRETFFATLFWVFSQMLQNSYIPVVTCAGKETGTQPRYEELVK